jgi:hypothetical protein
MVNKIWGYSCNRESVIEYGIWNWCMPEVTVKATLHFKKQCAMKTQKPPVQIELKILKNLNVKYNVTLSRAPLLTYVSF